MHSYVYCSCTCTSNTDGSWITNSEALRLRMGQKGQMERSISIGPVQPRKVFHLERWTRFSTSFPGLFPWRWERREKPLASAGHVFILNIHDNTNAWIPAVNSAFWFVDWIFLKPTCNKRFSGISMWDSLFWLGRNFSVWTEPIHPVLDRNFQKFWFSGSRPSTRKSN